MNAASARVVCSERFSSNSSTIAARRSAGSPGFDNAMRSSSLPSTMRENRKSSSSMSPTRSSACAISSSACAYASMRSAMSSVAPAHLVDEAVDELAVGVVVEVAFDDATREIDRQRRDLGPQLRERLVALVRDVGLGPLADLVRLLLGPREQITPDGLGRLAPFLDDASGLVAGVGDLGDVLRLLRLRLGPGILRRLEVVADAV